MCPSRSLQQPKLMKISGSGTLCVKCTCFWIIDGRYERLVVGWRMLHQVGATKEDRGCRVSNREVGLHLIKRWRRLQRLSHCAGRHYRTKLMSRYIGSGQKKTVWYGDSGTGFKSSKNGPFLRKNVFLGSIFGVFSCSVAISEPICMKFWLPG